MEASSFMFLYRQETYLLLGAHLMYMSVPFHRTIKTELTDWNEVLEAMFDRLVQIRDAHFGRLEVGSLEDAATSTPLEITPSDEEVRACCKAISACLAECGDSETDLDLHLGTRDRWAVELLLTKFLAIAKHKRVAD